MSNGLQSLNSTKNPAIVTTKLPMVSNCPLVPTMLSNTNIAITFNVNIIAPGKALVIRFGKNLPWIGSLFGCKDRKNAGIPITQVSSNNTWFVLKGYCVCKIKQNTDRNMVNNVFIKNNELLFWMLLITLRPSATTLGMLAKFESIKTKWLTFLVASLPLAIAIEQSASFKARMSLTPSPVMATLCPLFLSALTSIIFCSGETLPKTVYLSAASITCCSLSPSKLINFSAFSTPTRLLTSLTVIGLSPLIILIWTALSLNHWIVSAASSRMWSSITIIAIGVRFSGTLSPSIDPWQLASKITLNPLLAYCLTSFSTSAFFSFKTNSGAPKT